MTLLLDFSVQQVAFSTTEMALALNRYLCSAVLPLITKCAPLFAGSDHRAIMIDSMLHTIYRLSRGRAFTKAQRDIIEECLMALCKWVQPLQTFDVILYCQGHNLSSLCLSFFQTSTSIHASAPSETAGVWCAHSQWVRQNATEGKGTFHYFKNIKLNIPSRSHVLMVFILYFQLNLFASCSFWPITMSAVGNITASLMVGPTLEWHQKKSCIWPANCFGESLNR